MECRIGFEHRGITYDRKFAVYAAPVHNQVIFNHLYIMYYLNFYEKGSCQPRKRNGKVLSELFTYQDTDVQNAVHASNLQLTKRRSV